ncbi:MAG: hypothetical protein J3R72DRAFT_168449 [Linnemannia gamsii]|nr:MAG: hypothetical protein J3R72DRAFT_168449 [Linnemannia gamsii]
MRIKFPLAANHPGSTSLSALLASFNDIIYAVFLELSPLVFQEHRPLLSVPFGQSRSPLLLAFVPLFIICRQHITLLLRLFRSLLLLFWDSEFFSSILISTFPLVCSFFRYVLPHITFGSQVLSSSYCFISQQWMVVQTCWALKNDVRFLGKP